MNMRITRMAVLAAGFMTLGLAGCSQYVKQSDFNTAIQQLQQKQQDQQQQIDAIKQQMQMQFSKYDSQITSMQGRVSIDTVAHFAFNSASVNEQDKPALQDFAATISKYHPNVLITPHQAYLTQEALQEIADQTIKNLDLWQAGKCVGKACACAKNCQKNAETEKPVHS